MNKRSNEDLLKEYSDPSKCDYQHMNCYTLISRLDMGDLSALEVLKRIHVLGLLSSTYSYPSTLIDVLELHNRSNEQVSYDYENAKDVESKNRDYKILVYRSKNGDEDADQQLKLIELDKIL